MFDQRILVEMELVSSFYNRALNYILWEKNIGEVQEETILYRSMTQ